MRLRRRPGGISVQWAVPSRRRENNPSGMTVGTNEQCRSLVQR